jgi:hypothetical protein
MYYKFDQDRILNFFDRYMDIHYDLSYDHSTREFKTKFDKVYGYIMDRIFYYSDYEIELEMNQIFGENANEMLYDYLIKRFPNLKIHGIEM